MQQVQPLPKSALSEAFYARQISFYNLCIVDGVAQHPVFYTWSEELAGRGSIEISSALLDFQQNFNFEGINTIHLFCDRCFGQNKNNIVLHSLMKFLGSHDGSLRKIMIVFPVRGHLFLPADRFWSN